LEALERITKFKIFDVPVGGSLPVVLGGLAGALVDMGLKKIAKEAKIPAGTGGFIVAVVSPRLARLVGTTTAGMLSLGGLDYGVETLVKIQEFKGKIAEALTLEGGGGSFSPELESGETEGSYSPSSRSFSFNPASHSPERAVLPYELTQIEEKLAAAQGLI